MNSIVLIHGFPFDHHMWRYQVPALKWRAFALDLPGLGATHVFESPEEYSMASYATAEIGFLDALMMEQAVFCGLSMGGYIVFELLRRFPDRVRAAILCNTKADADTPEAKRGRDALAARTRKEGTSAVVDELINRVLAPVTRERRPDVVREVTQMILRQPVPGILGALHALRERPDSTPLLGEIRVPVLVVAGADDQITPAEGMREMANVIPGAEFVVIPEAGHLAPLEQPVAVNTAISAFLTKLG